MTRTTRTPGSVSRCQLPAGGFLLGRGLGLSHRLGCASGLVTLLSASFIVLGGGLGLYLSFVMCNMTDDFVGVFGGVLNIPNVVCIVKSLFARRHEGQSGECLSCRKSGNRLAEQPCFFKA